MPDPKNPQTGNQPYGSQPGKQQPGRESERGRTPGSPDDKSREKSHEQGQKGGMR